MRFLFGGIAPPCLPDASSLDEDLDDLCCDLRFFVAQAMLSVVSKDVSSQTADRFHNCVEPYPPEHRCLGFDCRGLRVDLEMQKNARSKERRKEVIGSTSLMRDKVVRLCEPIMGVLESVRKKRQA